MEDVSGPKRGINDSSSENESGPKREYLSNLRILAKTLVVPKGGSLWNSDKISVVPEGTNEGNRNSPKGNHLEVKFEDISDPKGDHSLCDWSVLVVPKGGS